MKRLLLIGLLGLSSMGAFADGPEYVLAVDGLACPFCAYGIEKQLNRIEGVRAIETEVANGQVIVSMRDGASFDRERAEKAVDDAGFTLNSFAER